MSKQSPAVRFSSIICLNLLFIISNCFASPTSNEFVPCQKMAVKVLEFCLNENAYSGNDFCWLKSKKAYGSCSKNVYQNHNPKDVKARKEAERNATQ